MNMFDHGITFLPVCSIYIYIYNLMVELSEHTKDIIIIKQSVR